MDIAHHPVRSPTTMKPIADGICKGCGRNRATNHARTSSSTPNTVCATGIAEELGVSDAIGALMVGLIVAETKAAHRVEHLVLPLRDAFAAVFFFSFGLTIDPGDVGEVALPVAAAIVLSLVLNVVAGIIGARMHGFGQRAAANAGLTLLGRGEFSLILVTLAAAAGLDRRLGPFVALYVVVLAIAGPLLASRSRILANRLPARIFTREAS